MISALPFSQLFKQIHPFNALASGCSLADKQNYTACCMQSRNKTNIRWANTKSATALFSGLLNGYLPLPG